MSTYMGTRISLETLIGRSRSWSEKLRTEDGTRSTEWAAASAGKEKLEPLSYRIIEVQKPESRRLSLVAHEDVLARG
jgi:hypothetical protein